MSALNSEIRVCSSFWDCKTRQVVRAADSAAFGNRGPEQRWPSRDGDRGSRPRQQGGLSTAKWLTLRKQREYLESQDQLDRDRPHPRRRLRAGGSASTHPARFSHDVSSVRPSRQPA